MKRKSAVKSEKKTKKKRKKVANILVDKSVRIDSSFISHKKKRNNTNHLFQTDLLLRSEILEMCHARGTEKSA